MVQHEIMTQLNEEIILLFKYPNIIFQDFAKYQPIALIWVSAIVMQINFVFTFGIPGGTLLYARNFTTLLLFPTTPFSVTANECPAAFVTASAPSTQLSGAFEARNLPLSCLGPLYNIALYLLLLLYILLTIWFHYQYEIGLLQHFICDIYFAIVSIFISQKFCDFLQLYVKSQRGNA
ncbi:hypothetical protein T08_14330 [Trichinella sp. T8]|nr:hypothetical protein T08_14330 [Trichinella sp. T8]